MFTGRNLFLKRKLPLPKIPASSSSRSARSASGSAWEWSPSRTPKLAPKLNTSAPSDASCSMMRTRANSSPPLGMSGG